MGVGSKSESRHFSPHLGLYAVPSHHPPSFGPLSSPSHQLPDYTLTFPRQVCPPHCHMFLLCSELSGGSHLQVKAKAVAIVLAMVHESLEHLSPPLASGTSLPTSSPLLSLLQLHWPSCCPQTCQAVSDPGPLHWPFHLSRECSFPHFFHMPAQTSPPQRGRPSMVFLNWHLSPVTHHILSFSL